MLHEQALEAVDGPIRGQAPLTEEANGPLNKKLEVICVETADTVKKQLAKVKLSDLIAAKK